jgi:serine/threonine protein kinase
VIPTAPQSPQTPQPPELVPGQLVGAGRYTLRWMLAAGGTCRVWLARDERLGDTVALKFLQPHLAQDPTLIAELRKEAAANRQLTHQNIVQLYDIYESSTEAPFLVMEFVEGASLHTLRQQKENEIYRWPELRPILLQLCSALDHAHGVQLIHRDLKPANILIDLTGRVKLADFGISASLADAYVELLGQRDTRGTVTFMSPQQMDGELPAVADDLYALGSTLYELLTGEPPFHTGDLSHQVQAVPPQPIAARLREKQIESDTPEPIAQLIINCLEKDPSKRPASIRAIAHAVDPVAATQPLFITPPPATARPTGRKTAASPRRKFSAEFYIVMALMAALLVIAAVTLWTVLKS